MFEEIVKELTVKGFKVDFNYIPEHKLYHAIVHYGDFETNGHDYGSMEKALAKAVVNFIDEFGKIE